MYGQAPRGSCRGKNVYGACGRAVLARDYHAIGFYGFSSQSLPKGNPPGGVFRKVMGLCSVQCGSQ